MFVKSLTQKMEREYLLDIAELNKISDLLHRAVSQARDTARGLYPGELEGPSLLHFLEELTSNTQNLSGISCQFFCPIPIFINDNNIATHIYKIAQEGISNAVKHGKAQSIKVSLIQHDGNVVLTIKDDGVGFMRNVKNSKGIGLKIMQYRANMIDASFQVESNVPHGVILNCILKDAP